MSSKIKCMQAPIQRALRTVLLSLPVGLLVLASCEMEGFQTGAAFKDTQELRISTQSIQTDNAGCISSTAEFPKLAFPICGKIASFWKTQYNKWLNSGFQSYFTGLPISTTLQVYNFDTNQYYHAQIFERSIAHHYPPDPTGVALMRLGEQSRALNQIPYSLHCEALPEFKSVFNSQGGLPIFGYPVSCPLKRKVEGIPKTVQYFERVRMEKREDSPLIEFGLIVNELDKAGKLTKKKECGDGREKRTYAFCDCFGCKNPNLNGTTAMGWALGWDNCPPAQTKCVESCIAKECDGLQTVQKGCKNYCF